MGKFVTRRSPPSTPTVSRQTVGCSTDHGGGVEHPAFVRSALWSEEKEEEEGEKPNAKEN